MNSIDTTSRDGAFAHILHIASATSPKALFDKLREAPDAGVLVVDRAGCLFTSYATLADDALAAAERLQAAGLARRDRIGVLARNAYVRIVLDLAIIELGCV
ncbi:hypothetical protein, partial [Methylosinus sp. R-45379]|uniref:hypothetical protein n=1 Tax=Methylosinus sp. R-45379 TaxID=980563 RepID=UPI000B221049